MAALPLESIQITAGRNGTPSPSTATVPDHWAVHPTPTTPDGASEDCSKTRRHAATTALHQAEGSCSAPPPGSRRNGTGSDALAAILPCGETSATLGPPVPRSTPSTNASWSSCLPDAPPSVPGGAIAA